MKYHNHTRQTNPRHREEESQNIYITICKTINDSKATSFLFLFLFKMIAKLKLDTK